MNPWRLSLRGGTFNGFEGEFEGCDPPPVVVAFGGELDGRVTSDVFGAAIDEATAVAYRRVAISDRRRHAAYQVGEDAPDPERRAGFSGPSCSEPRP